MVWKSSQIPACIEHTDKLHCKARNALTWLMIIMCGGGMQPGGMITHEPGTNVRIVKDILTFHVCLGGSHLTAAEVYRHVLHIGVTGQTKKKCSKKN